MSANARNAATKLVGEQVDRETAEVMQGIAGEARDESEQREPGVPDYIGISLGQVGELMPHPSVSQRLLGDETKTALLEQAAQFRDHLMALNPSTGGKLAMSFGGGRLMVFPMGRVLQGVARTMLTQAYYSAGTARRAYEGYQALSATIERRRETNPDAIDGDASLTEQSRAAEKVTRSLLDACTWMALAKVLVPFAMRETDGEPILARVRNPAKQDERPQSRRPIVSDAVALLAGLGGWTEAPPAEVDPAEEARQHNIDAGQAQLNEVSKPLVDDDGQAILSAEQLAEVDRVVAETVAKRQAGARPVKEPTLFAQNLRAAAIARLQKQIADRKAAADEALRIFEAAKAREEQAQRAA